VIIKDNFQEETKNLVKSFNNLYNFKRLPRYLSNLVIKKLIQHYININISPDTNNILIKQEFFKEEELYNNFLLYNRLKDYFYIEYDYTNNEKMNHVKPKFYPDDFVIENTKIYFNREFSEIIKEKLESISQNKKYVENPNLYHELINLEREEIPNIPNIEQYKNKYGDERYQEILKTNNIDYELNEETGELNILNTSHTIDFDIEDDSIVVPLENIEIENLHTLFIRSDNQTFLINPRIKLQKTLPELKDNSIVKLKFKVIRRVQRKSDIFGLNWCSEYKIKCPRCNALFKVLPHEMGQNIKHLCKGDYKPQYQTINRKLSVLPHISKNLFLYECVLYEEMENKLIMNKNIFIYTEIPDLKPQLYVGDLFFAKTYPNLSENNPKQINLLYLLGHKKETPNTNHNLLILNNPEAWELSKRLNVKHTKIIDILYSVRKMIKDRTKFIEITDRGTLLQLFTIISGLARNLFEYPKIAINVMGDKSIGKTFVAGMIGMTMDEEFGMVENSENMSLPGFQGGINNNKNINGKSESVFEPGIVTKYGLVVLDEAERMFSDKQLNLALKNFPNRSLNIEKVGGENDVPQNYTPIMCSNFYDYYHNGQYLTMIKEVYYTFARKDLTNTFHPSNRLDMNKYIDKCNIFLTLSKTQEKYKNENLTKAIYYTRNKMENSNIDWRTGGRIESSYRLLFDCVVQVKKNKMVKNEDRIVRENTPTTLPEHYVFPVTEFLSEIRHRLLNNRTNINLYDYQLLDEDIMEQINSIKRNIAEFVRNWDNNIHLHLAGNNREIDPKLYAVFENMCVVVQMVEDHTSTELSENIKDLILKLVMKCKRGLTEEEYNFKDHEFNGDLIQFDYDELDLDVKKTQEELDNEKLKRMMTKKEREQQEETEEQQEQQEQQEEQQEQTENQIVLDLNQKQMEEMFNDANMVQHQKGQE
jgi:hypothetical protein